MSLAAATLLRNLALGQAMLIAPALGDSYEGKSAGTISAMLLMIAADLEAEAANAARFDQRLVALLSQAASAGSPLSADLAQLLAQTDGLPPPARMDRLLGALARVHEWADAEDAALAARCRDFLADWAGARRIAPPLPPAAPAASA